MLQHLVYMPLFTKFQTACGYEYTHKLHRMFTDMNISTDLNSKFSKYLESSNQQFKINFSLLVLQVRVSFVLFLFYLHYLLAAINPTL